MGLSLQIMNSAVVTVTRHIVRCRERAGRYAKYAYRIALGVFLMLSASVFAEGQSYRGLMIPNAHDAVIPISITVERFAGKLKGKLTSPPPFGGEAVFLADVRNVHQCEFTTTIGVGRTLMFDGFCLTNTIEGNYTL